MQKTNHIYLLLILGLITAIVTSSCTKELNGSLPDFGTSKVVDGNIENGKPPIILFSRSTKVFGDLNVNDLESFYLHGAVVTMTVDSNPTPIVLPELCLRDLAVNDTQKIQLLQALGITVYDSSSVPNVCAYTLPTAELYSYFTSGSCPNCGEEGHTYHLNIQYNGKNYTATTTIPKALGVTSLGIKPNPRADSLVNVTVTFTVPPTYGNFICYWTKRNSEPFYTPYTGSVYDDKIFSGLTLTFPVERGIPGYVANPDPATFGYFWKGDTVTVKWASIDSKTYDFYFSLENDGGGSPFSSPIRVKSNIQGDSVIGIWAGYGAKYYNLIVPK